MVQLPSEVRSPRLRLRIWQPGDGAVLTTAVTESIEHLRPWMPWIGFEPVSASGREELIAGWIDAWRDGGEAVYGAFDADDVFVAAAGLHRRAGPECLEIGYWVHLDHVGKGYATEITEALTDAAFTVEGIDRVELHIDQANQASTRVANKLEFARGPESQDEIAAPGESGIDCCWFVMRDEWLARP